MKGLLDVVPVLETLILFTSVIDGCPLICNCFDYITDCQNKDLNELPNGTDSNVISLDLSINKFENIPSNLDLYYNLKYLNLSSNRIATIGHLDFTGSSNLEILDLSNNFFHDWKDIHSQAFMSLRYITVIDFSSNPISNLAHQTTHFKLKSLEILKLNNCSLTSLPSGFLSGMTNVKEIHVHANPFQILKVNLSSQSLKFIDICCSTLSYVSPSTFKALKTLEVIKMNNNKYLRNITINSESLINLDLSESFLETTPYGNMRSLSKLNLYGNIIRTLKNNVFINMPNLIFINVSLNAITYIEGNAFRGLEDLISLDLSFNKLNIIEENTFLATKSLLYLNLSHNYLTAIDSISSMSLDVLDVSYCEIKNVEKNALSTLPKLTYLSLQRNFITNIPDRLVGDRLTILDLSNCRIKTISNETFEDMVYLKELDLSNNRLSTIHFTNFPTSLTSIRLKDNQWRCECTELRDTFLWLQLHDYFTDDLICDSPDIFDGLTWQSACQDQWNPPVDQKTHIWWYSIILLISMVFLLISVVVLRKINDIRDKRFREVEERRRQNEREARETLERMQRIQREYREEASRNAPDPRESQGPPSYNDALLLPRLDSSHPSLAGSLHSIHGSNSDIKGKKKVRRKKRRRAESLERLSARSVVIDASESEPERSQRPLESDF